jgi:hypothetical protein
VLEHKILRNRPQRQRASRKRCAVVG